MEKWQKIEQFINFLIVRVIELLRRLVLRCTPKKVSDQVQRTKHSYQKKKAKIQTRIIHQTKSSGSLAKSFSRQLRILFFSTQEKILIFAQKAKTIKPKDSVLLFIAFLSPLAFKLKSWWLSLRPETVALFFTGSMMGSLTLIGLITSGSKIAQDKEEAMAREPASKVENATAISSRPHYYKLPEKSYTLLNVQLPIYVGGSNDLKGVLVDFTIISSNRYIRQFFLGRETLVQDRLNSYMEPIETKFLFDDEGKRIIKEKIQYELNLLLKENDVAGEVDEVHVHSMLAI